MRVVEAFRMALMTSCVTLLRDHPGEAAEPTRKRGVFPVPDMSPRHAGADPKPPEANLALPAGDRRTSEFRMKGPGDSHCLCAHARPLEGGLPVNFQPVEAADVNAAG